MGKQILSLPMNVNDEIFRYLDCEALLQMRKVCKAISINVSVFMYKENTIVSKIAINHASNDGWIRIIINFEHCEQHFLFWKFAIFPTLEMNPNVESSDSHRRLHYLILKMKSEEEAEAFLECLSPLISRAQFSAMGLYHIKSQKLAQKWFEVFDKKHIPKFDVSFAGQEHNFSQLLYFMQQCGPNYASMNDIPCTTPATEFLVELSSVVDTLIMSRPLYKNGASHKITLSLIEEILIRRCSILTIFNTSSLSLADAEKLVQIFHHMEKKVYFTTWIGNMQLRELNIGSYEVSVTGNGGKLLIKHWEIDSTFHNQ